MNSVGFCKNGHDLSLEGRYSSGACKLCQRESARKNMSELRAGRVRKRTGPKVRQHCLRGHDTSECGRTKRGQCLECMRERTRANTEAKQEALEAMPSNDNGGRRCRRCEGMSWRRPLNKACECGETYEEERMRA
jgi:hypothetical protein